MKYSFGYNNDLKLIEKVSIFCQKNKIFKKNIEFFNGFAGFKSSLNRFYNENISLIEFESSIKGVLSNGFKFNYLMNSKTINYRTIDKELLWLKKLGVRYITISNFELIDYINKKFFNFKIVVSIIAETKNKFDILKLKKYKNIDRIIFHQSINHKFKKLINLVKFAKLNGFKTELLANELCFTDCELRKEHYKESSKYNGVSCDFFDKLGNFCIEQRKDISIIDNSPWIRPEDIIIYEKLGINYIKLAGRNCDSDILFSTIKAYLEKKYEGNFFYLMDLDGKKLGGREEKRKLNNKKLDGILYAKFLKEFKSI